EYSRFHPELKPGQFAVLAFGDTGCGMDKETQAKIFEPFFTTKEENIGTGLGLSTVYGIAKQNGGGVNVYSEPGYGTIIRIYIPRFVGEETPIALSETVRQLTGNETILVVEDEEQIMRLCQRMLERNGYTVIAVDKPGEAIVLCEKHPGPIHLLVTDVIMPSMDGKELNDRIKAMQPDVRTLYMSGYTANIIASRGIQAEGDYFIQKPLSPKAFLTKIREILDSQPAEKKGLGMK
ncbi:MAG: response regulator, partial [Desulfatitalea sp.]|nr:response regulator [Desulfatitalea sp.]